MYSTVKHPLTYSLCYENLSNKNAKLRKKIFSADIILCNPMDTFLKWVTDNFLSQLIIVHITLIWIIEQAVNMSNVPYLNLDI